jgi:DNA-binding transcriptional MerR regulator
MPDRGGLLGIGDLARRTGTSDATLRFYEKVGLLRPTERVGGRRRYDPSSAEQVALVRLCQDAGFTLREIREFLRHRNRAGRAWSELAERKIRELDARIADAERARQLLRHALDCSSPSLFECPHFQRAVAQRVRAAPAARPTTRRTAGDGR